MLSLLAGYVRFQGLDTNTVQQTAGDLIADDEIRDQVAASLVEQLYANVDVSAELEQRLPPDQKGLAGPAAAGLREFSDRAATRMLERPRVQALWVNTVTHAHGQLINVPPDLGGFVRRGLGRMRGGSPEQDRLEALERLGRLREQGVLTDEEFAAEKAALVRD